MDLGAYILVPEYGFEFPWSERAELAEELNSRFSGGEVLAEFGDNPIPVKYFETVPRGNPKFSIRRGFILGRPRDESGPPPEPVKTES